MGRTARYVGIATVVLLLVVFSLPFLINANDFRPMLVSQLSQALGRPVKLGDLKLSILSGGVAAADLSIADDPAFSQAPFVSAKSMRIGVELWPFISERKLNVNPWSPKVIVAFIIISIVIAARPVQQGGVG